MASQGQPSDLEDIQMKDLAKAWANINGGRLWLQAVNKLAQVKNNKFEEDEILFNASEEEFIKHGETKIEHIRWRQLELYELCERTAFYLTKDLNKDNQSEDHIDIDEDIYDIDESHTKLLIEPQIRWDQLEAAVTDWYLKTKLKTCFEIDPNHPAAKNCSKHASVRYYEWKQTNEENTPNIYTTKEEEKPQVKENNVGTKVQEKITWDDLETGELDKEAASMKIQNWMKEDKNKISRTLDEIQTALKSSSRKASEKHNNGEGEPFPIQLGYNQDYDFNRLAMVRQGKKGRGNSAKYRVIKVPNVDN
jgi:hypothetical protein